MPMFGMGQQQPMGGFGASSDSAQPGGMTTPQPYNALGPGSGLQMGQQQLQGAIENLRRMQERCSRGDGNACIQAQGLQQRVNDMQMKHQMGMQMQGMRGQGGGTMGMRGRGGRPPVNPNDFGSMMLQNMYGVQGGYGGGGMG